MTLEEAFSFHTKNSVPYCFTLFQPYSRKFFEFLSEAREKEYWHIDDKEIFGQTDIGKFDIFEEDGSFVPLDLPVLCEAKSEYQGKAVELNKPKRGGSKKYYVYTRNPQTGKVIKVAFGAEGGGQNLRVKINDPEARNNFASRHNCKNKKDKTKAGYWSCRLPRYASMLGLDVKNPSAYW
jgi:hypothetical protein